MNPHLVCYIEQNILPQYQAFADGHDRTHIETVLCESLFLADRTMKQWFSDARRTAMAEDIVRRIMLYGRANFPEYTVQQQIDRACAHLRKKFCESGCLHFRLNGLQGLADLRTLAADDAQLVALCNQYLFL